MSFANKGVALTTFVLATLTGCQQSAGTRPTETPPAPQPGQSTARELGPRPNASGKQLAPPAASAASARPAPSRPESVRHFEFDYTASLTLPDGNDPVDIFIPIAVSDSQQTIHELEVQSTTPGSFATEAAHGNRFWHARVERPSGEKWSVSAQYTLTRKPFHKASLAGAGAQLSSAERQTQAKYLQANAKVPINDPVLTPILAQVRQGAATKSPGKLTRAIYDWVIDNMEYKKVGTGWGHGDTYWACSEKYGNCTDFHSLFISLARTESIPARFEMGFPIPTQQAAGNIKGYHCWLQFYLPNVGWVPVDASEAKKHPERRDELFAAQPADRIRLTTGRDLQLGEYHRAGKLNYFVYPHVEVAGASYTGEIDKSFSYRQLPPRQTDK